MSEKLAPLLVVVGPTATGKSRLAARLAQRCHGEVISADSVQVYRHFDVGSGKPSADELALAPHHLVDVRDPLEPLEANVWAGMAEEKVREIRERGKLPIVCGGTFLWVRALIYGLAEAPPADEEIRVRHRQRAETEGRQALHDELARIDAKSAERLHPNDLVRVSRALEVYELTGRTLSAIQQDHGFREKRFDATLVSLDWEREAYEERLARRVRTMWKEGWLDEVRALLDRGYAESRAMDAVGYRQVRAFAETEDAVDEEELLTSIIRVTRIFARRQRTWLRDEEQISAGVDCLEQDEALNQLVEELGLLFD